MLGAIVVALLSCPLPSQAAEQDVGLSLRYRAEAVDQDGFEDNALASTLLLRLNYETQDWNAWNAFVEFDYVAEVASDNFNSGAGTSSAARARYPVVPDPNGGDLNQIYVQRGFADGGLLRIGRQRIVLDNQRFVGGVAWRQNEQTYDGVSVTYPVNPSFETFYAYVNNVNRIFGNRVPGGDHKSNTHLFEGRWNTSSGSLLMNAYLLDNDDVAAFSTRTVGLAWKGRTEVSGRRLIYRAQYARQNDNGDNPTSFSANYWRVDGKIALDVLNVGVGIEILGSGGEGGGAFATPLATLFAFNGWTDRFLATPATGLEDRWISLSGKAGNVNWLVRAHDFQSDRGGIDYGQELNVSLGTKLGSKKQYSVLLRGATFSGDSTVADATKLWLLVSRKLR